MRLFILSDDTSYHITKNSDCNTLTLHEGRIIRHAHVIRLRYGEDITIQIGNTRYLGVVDQLDRATLTIAIHSSQLQPPSCADKPITMAIALPNTGNKLDMIVEKLTEVGVHHIIFFSAERSQIRTLEDKKLYRLHILAIEAAEQSHRWTIPTIQYIQHIHDVLSVDGSKVIFDKEATGTMPHEATIGLVGPEGGWSPSELQQMEPIACVTLGEHILRMETAAIVGGWTLAQHSTT